MYPWTLPINSLNPWKLYDRMSVNGEEIVLMEKRVYLVLSYYEISRK